MSNDLFESLHFRFQWVLVNIATLRFQRCTLFVSLGNIFRASRQTLCVRGTVWVCELRALRITQNVSRASKCVNTLFVTLGTVEGNTANFKQKIGQSSPIRLLSLSVVPAQPCITVSDCKVSVLTFSTPAS